MAYVRHFSPRIGKFFRQWSLHAHVGIASLCKESPKTLPVPNGYLPQLWRGLPVAAKTMYQHYRRTAVTASLIPYSVASPHPVACTHLGPRYSCRSYHLPCRWCT